MFKNSLLVWGGIFLLVIVVAVGFKQRLNAIAIKFSPSPSATETPPPSASPSPSQTPKPTLFVVKSTPNPTKAPMATEKSNSNQSNNFIYPGATITSTSGNTTNLTTSDNPTDVTNWYKNQIASSGFNVKTFITNTTNGNVNNKLSGSNGSEEIVVDITKNTNDSNTSIALTITYH